MKSKAPCKDCADRVVGCHSTCDLYKEFAEKRQERNKLIREQKSAHKLGKDAWYKGSHGWEIWKSK